MDEPNEHDNGARRDDSRCASSFRRDFYADEVVALLPDFPQAVRDWTGTTDPDLVRRIAYAEYDQCRGEALHWQHIIDHYDTLMKETL